MKLSITIPAHNEEERIPKTLEEYLKFFGELKKDKMLDFEIITVLNNCSDNTLGVVKKFAEKNKEIRYLDFEEQGKGFAIIKGFKDALKRDSDLIGFVDADMSTRPEYYYDLVKNLNGYDGVIASRSKKGAVVKTTLLREITHKGFSFLVRSILFLKIYDSQCGAKIFRREVIEKTIDEIGSTLWTFDVDMLYRIKKRGFKINEIPTVWENAEKSRINLMKTPVRMFSGVIRLRLLNSPFKFIVRAYDLLPEKIKIHHE